jgi:hypothetical protein
MTNMVKTILLALAFSVGLAAADKKPAAKPVGPPAGAERLNDTQWKHTDSAGKVWVYTRTPFGWSRGPEEKLEKKEQTPGPALEVVEIGEKDAVFQRATPFGKSRWTKALSALDDAEKAAVEAARK